VSEVETYVDIAIMYAVILLLVLLTLSIIAARLLAS
jgi:hypothetical protein